MYTRLYHDGSKAEGGTLSQLRFLINRTNVPAKRKENVNAAEEFFEAVVISHFIAAALDYFKMESLDDCPTTLLSLIEKEKNKDSKRKLFHSKIEDFVKAYINIKPLDFDYDPTTTEAKDDDQVRAYAKEILSFGTILMEFNDAVHEGDGKRLMRVWKYFLLTFRSANKTKYSLEGLLLLIKVHSKVLPERLKHQLMYSRFVNTRGRTGANIPIDLHVEHVNRIIKTAIYSQVSNLSPLSVIRSSRCTGVFANITNQFDNVSFLHPQSSSHSQAKLNKDIERIVKQLHHTSKVFVYHPKRAHHHYKIVNSGITKCMKSEEDKQQLISWMKKYLQKSAASNY